MKIFNIQLDNIKYIDFFKKITSFEKQEIVFTPNPEILLKTIPDKEFESLLNKATILTPDGIWLYIAYQMLEDNSAMMRVLKIPIYFYHLFFNKHKLYEKYWERICWSDVTKDLLFYCESEKIAITIIDLYNPNDEGKVASQKIFSERFSSVFPELQFDYIIYNPEKKSEILEQIKSSDSKIVFSTLGMKKQEESVIEIMDYCKNIKLWLWIGSSFDYFIGFQKRAPQIFSTLWIEWFYRIFTWPQKMKRLKRVYNAIFVFLYQVLKQK
jgi:N-acetylglucosaminyldiphosphoundecaprenol N-acetyl-beta-D-mannosaminyltransferase